MKIISIIDYMDELTKHSEICHPINDGFIEEHDLKKFVLLNICGDLNIIHVQLLYKVNKKLQVYHRNVKMARMVEYKWSLNNCFKTGQTCYYSPLFDNDNWCLIFKKKKVSNKCEIILQLLSLPARIYQIYVKWKIVIDCNGNKMEYEPKYTKPLKIGSKLFESVRICESEGVITISIIIEILKATTIDYNVDILCDDSKCYEKTIEKHNLCLFEIFDNNKNKNYISGSGDDNLLLQKEMIDAKINGKFIDFDTNWFENKGCWWLQ
eukprot:487667_1